VPIAPDVRSWAFSDLLGWELRWWRLDGVSLALHRFSTPDEAQRSLETTFRASQAVSKVRRRRSAKSASEGSSGRIGRATWRNGTDVYASTPPD
jgi:hypothetical protein